MINLEIEKVSPTKILVDWTSIKKLINIAEKVDKINLIEKEDDIDIQEIMKLEEKGGAFDFLNDKKEDIYSIDDVKEKYQ